MAEIIIRKKSKRIWPWILEILVVLAILVWPVLQNPNIADQVGHLQTSEQTEMAARHLRYIPEVMITKLETFLA